MRLKPFRHQIIPLRLLPIRIQILTLALPHPVLPALATRTANHAVDPVNATGVKVPESVIGAKVQGNVINVKVKEILMGNSVSLVRDLVAVIPAAVKVNAIGVKEVASAQNVLCNPLYGSMSGIINDD